MNLRDVRERKNISQYRLSKLSGISQGLLSAYESGQKKPGMNNIIKLSEALNVDISELINPNSAA